MSQYGTGAVQKGDSFVYIANKVKGVILNPEFAIDEVTIG